MSKKLSYWEFDQRLKEPRWFVAFCDERIKSITDYDYSNDPVAKEMLKIFEDERKKMENHINGLRIVYFGGLFK